MIHPKLLNYEEIVSRGIFTHPLQSGLEYTNATINLTVGTIIKLDDYAEVKSFKIPPRGMALVISDEVMKIPNGVVGYTTVKNGLSLKGIMAVNIGIVDNGWEGPISSILINFGREAYELKEHDVFLRMTFHEFDLPSVEARSTTLPPQTKESYIAQRKHDARAYLSDTFLVLNQVKKQIRKELIKSLWKYVGLVSLILAVLAVVVSVIIYVVNYTSDVIDYQTRIKASKEFKILNGRFDSLTRVNDQREKLYQSEIEELRKGIKTLKRADSTDGD